MKRQRKNGTAATAMIGGKMVCLRCPGSGFNDRVEYNRHYFHYHNPSGPKKKWVSDPQQRRQWEQYQDELILRGTPEPEQNNKPEVEMQKKPKSGWSTDPEERKAEMARRRQASHKKDKVQPKRWVAVPQEEVPLPGISASETDPLRTIDEAIKQARLRLELKTRQLSELNRLKTEVELLAGEMEILEEARKKLLSFREGPPAEGLEPLQLQGVAATALPGGDDQD